MKRKRIIKIEDNLTATVTVEYNGAYGMTRDEHAEAFEALCDNIINACRVKLPYHGSASYSRILIK